MTKRSDSVIDASSGLAFRPLPGAAGTDSFFEDLSQDVAPLICGASRNREKIDERQMGLVGQFVKQISFLCRTRPAGTIP